MNKKEIKVHYFVDKDCKSTLAKDNGKLQTLLWLYYHFEIDWLTTYLKRKDHFIWTFALFLWNQWACNFLASTLMMSLFVKQEYTKTRNQLLIIVIVLYHGKKMFWCFELDHLGMTLHDEFSSHMWSIAHLHFEAFVFLIDKIINIKFCSK